ncbi:MAG TPA: hypothetical protein VMW75_01635 [Thermoanaerobaculia bacterium]|nr:hypothetical protein [Thermoanaerobaculia bacterium]
MKGRLPAWPLLGLPFLAWLPHPCRRGDHCMMGRLPAWLLLGLLFLAWLPHPAAVEIAA